MRTLQQRHWKRLKIWDDHVQNAEEKSLHVAVRFGFFQVRDAPPIHHVVIQGDRIRAFGFSTNPAAANRARTSSSATNSTTDGASEDQNLQFHPTTTIPLPSSPTSHNEDGGELHITHAWYVITRIIK